MTFAPMLIEAGRWADAGALFARPLATLAKAADLRAFAPPAGEHAPPGMLESFRTFAEASLRETASNLVRALRAAQRVDDATAVDAEARRLDPSSEMATALARSAPPAPT